MNPLVRASVFTLGILFSFVFLILISVGLYTETFSLSTAIILTIIINFLLWAVGPFISDFIYKILYKAHFFTKDEFAGKYPQLSEFIAQVTRTHNFTFPKIGFINDRNPTAFTYGSTRNNARIIITEGLIHYLNIEEQKAVLAHELGHIYHLDFLIMSVAVTMVQILYELYIVLARSKNSSSDKKGNALSWLGFVSYIFYIIGTYLILYLSRIREYYADSFSARVTGNPHALVQGLVKIAYGIVQAEDTDSSKRLLQSTRALGVMDIRNAGFISGVVYSSNDPEVVAEVMAFDNVSPWAKILELSSTHPLTGRRISALEKIASSLGQAKLVDFDVAYSRMNIDKGRLYSGFIFEAGIYFLPLILPLFGFFMAGIGGALIAFGLGSTINLFYRLREGKAVPSTVLEQMRNVYASPMRGIPVSLDGQITGRGVPGYIFSEDMMFQDRSGLSYLDYVSVFGFIGNFFFAMGKIKKLIGVQVKAEGWFFRGLSHHITLKKILHDSSTISSHPRFWVIVRNAVIMIAGLFLFSI